jgi:hypothetical protein
MRCSTGNTWICPNQWIISAFYSNTVRNDKFNLVDIFNFESPDTSFFSCYIFLLLESRFLKPKTLLVFIHYLICAQ